MQRNDINCAVVSGTLTQEIKVKTAKNNKQYYYFSIENVKSYTGKDGNPYEKRTFLNVICWS